MGEVCALATSALPGTSFRDLDDNAEVRGLARKA